MALRAVLSAVVRSGIINGGALRTRGVIALRVLQVFRRGGRHAVSPIQRLHYALTRPAVASVPVGYSNASHVGERTTYGDASAGERDYASVLATASEHPVSGLCTYCGHCAPCTVGIDIASVNKFFDLAELQVAKDEPLSAPVADHCKALEAHADACISCGICETNSPFGVPITERMEAAAEPFG